MTHTLYPVLGRMKGMGWALIAMLAVGWAAPTWAEDSYEENDTRATATDFTAGERENLSTALGELGDQADEDWFEIELSGVTNRAVVACSFTHADGNINIQLINHDQTSTVTAQSRTDNELIDTSGLATGTYYIRVYGDNADNSYDLWWDDLTGSADDEYEDNDVVSAAYNFSSGERNWLSTVDGPGIQRDEDWFQIFVSNSSVRRVIAKCLFNDSAGDLLFQLIDTDGSTILATGTTVDDGELIDYTVAASGAYFLRVSSVNAGQTYDLWWDDVGIDNDAYEYNDTQGSAFDLGGYNSRPLSSVFSVGRQDDSDWYRIEVPEGSMFGNSRHLQIGCTFDDTWGNIDMTLCNTTGTVLTTASSVQDFELIDYWVPHDGVFYLHVYGDNTGDADITYNLWWDNIYSSFMFPEDDDYEGILFFDNDTRANATDMTDHERKWFSEVDGPGIQRDSDWYEIEVSALALEVAVECRFDHADGNIDLALYDNAGTTLSTSRTTTDNEYIFHTVSASGTYYLRVWGDNNGQSYNVWWDDIWTGSDAYDLFRPNNNTNTTRATGFDISWLSDTWLSSYLGLAQQANDDWYEILVPEGETQVYVGCDFTHSSGDINIQLVASDDTVLASSTSGTNDERILFNVDTATYGYRYWVRVYGDNANNSYNLIWDTSPAGDDAYEENDTRPEAFYLNERQYLSNLRGGGTQLDDDWYEIQVMPSSYRRVIVSCQPFWTNTVGVSLYNSTGTLLAESNSEAYYEVIDYTVGATGTYYIRVHGDNWGDWYNLWWDDVRTNDDAYEQNDTRVAAFDGDDHAGLPERRWLGEYRGRGVQADEDWFEINVNSSSSRHVLVDCLFDHANGDINLELYDNTDTLLIASDTTNDNEHLEYDVPSTGDYYIRVYNADNTSATYNLWWDDTGSPPPAGDDNYEQNDSMLSAYDLSTHHGVWLSSVSGQGVRLDDDYYRVSTVAGQPRLDVYLETAGNMYVMLIDASGYTLAYSQNRDYGRFLQFVTPGPGDYYLKVYGGASGTTYDLRWFRTHEFDAVEPTVWSLYE